MALAKVAELDGILTGVLELGGFEGIKLDGLVDAVDRRYVKHDETQNDNRDLAAQVAELEGELKTSRMDAINLRIERDDEKRHAEETEALFQAQVKLRGSDLARVAELESSMTFDVGDGMNTVSIAGDPNLTKLIAAAWPSHVVGRPVLERAVEMIEGHPRLERKVSGLEAERDNWGACLKRFRELLATALNVSAELHGLPQLIQMACNWLARVTALEEAIGSYIEDNGPCGDDEDSPYCGDDGCSYCGLIRLCDAPGDGGEGEKDGPG